MNDLTKARFAMLAKLTNCPACGALREAGTVQQGTKSVVFSCTAVFSASTGRTIEPTVPCPAPSLTAAEALNEQVELEIRRASR